MSTLKEDALARREQVIKLQEELRDLQSQIVQQRAAISADLANGFEADYSEEWWADREETYGLLKEHLRELFPS